jgi:hypothetical protein
MPRNVTGDFLDAARTAEDLIAAPAVAAKWNEPSALREFAVSGLAGHLARQVIMVPALLQREAPKDPEVIGILDHYARVPWVDAALEDEANVSVRRSSQAEAADGPAALARRTRDTIARLEEELPGQDLARPVYLPWTGWALILADFLTTRTLELVIHVDDLVVSIGAEPVQTPGTDVVLALLTQLAARRHGSAAVLRALSRRERAPAAIAAF